MFATALLRQTTGTNNNSDFLCDLVYCPPLLEVQNATNETDTSGRTVGTVIQYRCHAGHIFPDDTKNVTIRCNAQGVWMWDTAPKKSHCSGSKTTNFSLICWRLVLVFNCKFCLLILNFLMTV